MNKVEKIKAYLEDRREKLEDIKNRNEWTTAELGDLSCCKQTLSFIDSLEEEPISEDLEEACDEYYNETWDEHGGKAMVVDGCHDIWFPSQATDDFFKAGALWQKKQMMKNSAFINEAEWEDDIHKLFREKGKKVKLMIVEEE